MYERKLPVELHIKDPELLSKLKKDISNNEIMNIKILVRVSTPPVAHSSSFVSLFREMRMIQMRLESKCFRKAITSSCMNILVTLTTLWS